MTTLWTAPPIERHEPALAGTERESLDMWLEYHRETLLHKCSGLTADQLKQLSVPPSALSLLGLVRHMVEVERWWFSNHIDGQPIHYEYCTEENMNADFDDLADADAEADLAAYQREIEASRRIIATRDLEDTFESRGHRKRTFTVRWAYLHMIEEYARHTGHADLLREAIDGATGD